MLPAGPEATWGSLLPKMLQVAAPGAGASWQSWPQGPAEPELLNFSRNGEMVRVRGGGVGKRATSPARELH